MDNNLTSDEDKILFIVQTQIELLGQKAIAGPLSLDDCKKLQILHTSYDAIVHRQEVNPQEGIPLTISSDDLVKYIETLSKPKEDNILELIINDDILELSKNDDNDSGRT